MPLLDRFEYLVISDSLELLAGVRSALSDAGASVLTATNPRDGLLLANQAYPYAVVVDLDLAGGAGPGVIAALKKLPGLSRIPVLALVSTGDPAATERAKALGAAEALRKPAAAEALVSKLERLTKRGPFKAAHFGPDQLEGVSLEIPVEVISVGEAGYVIEGPVILSRERMVKFDWELSQELGCTELKTRTVARETAKGRSGGYLGELNLIGVTAKLAKALRALGLGKQQAPVR